MKKPYLSRQEILEALDADHLSPAEMEVGRQYRVSHSSCMAGADTRKRLYIRKLDTGYGLYFCHNCGVGGQVNLYTISRPPTFFNSKPTKKTSEDASKSFVEDSYKLIKGPEDVDPLVLKYIAPYMHLIEVHNKSTHYRNRVGFYSGYDKFLCYYDDLGYQVRRIYPNGERHIITAKQDQDAVLFGHLYSSEKFSDTVVITEDTLSALVAHRSMDCEMDSISLLGTHISNELCLKVSEIYQRAIIWLDNDSATVLASARQIARKLDLLGVCTLTISSIEEPKKYYLSNNLRPILGK